MNKPRILFLCTGNSCRSQMAEGWAKALLKADYEISSAGIEAHGLNPNAVKVMDEAGIDISSHQSQTLNELDQKRFDYIFTVCDHAHQTCPASDGSHIIQNYFDDPPRLSASVTNEEESLNIYRRVRDEIKIWIQQLPHQIHLLNNN
ncbi:arsenate reductase ArsC [Endozoicomonas arenosclerae]|uniref:arsenate reductase ArsC n=1 Tax=Endozoicomonas arenosclerae TaxID=1633495 RepID=UPI0007824790|nr:arsenate reductase ArsC [Endozoicomonas arenosclerae]